MYVEGGDGEKIILELSRLQLRVNLRGGISWYRSTINTHPQSGNISLQTRGIILNDNNEERAKIS